MLICYIQVVICIPVPEIAAGKTKRSSPENIELNERTADDHEDETLDDMGRRGHILWIRGLTRLQTQVSSSSSQVSSSSSRLPGAR